jgi:hypothetical protein
MDSCNNRAFHSFYPFCIFYLPPVTKFDKIFIEVIRIIEMDKLKAAVRSYLPNIEEPVIENITHDILRDAESIIHSMIRQAVNQEREKIYRESNKK